MCYLVSCVLYLELLLMLHKCGQHVCMATCCLWLGLVYTTARDVPLVCAASAGTAFEGTWRECIHRNVLPSSNRSAATELAMWCAVSGWQDTAIYSIPRQSGWTQLGLVQYLDLCYQTSMLILQATTSLRTLGDKFKRSIMTSAVAV